MNGFRSFFTTQISIPMDYSNLKQPADRLAWACGRLTGLIYTDRFDIEEEFLDELREVLYVMENQ